VRRVIQRYHSRCDVVRRLLGDSDSDWSGLGEAVHVKRIENEFIGAGSE